MLAPLRGAVASSGGYLWRFQSEAGQRGQQKAFKQQCCWRCFAAHAAVATSSGGYLWRFQSAASGASGASRKSSNNNDGAHAAVASSGGYLLVDGDDSKVLPAEVSII